MIELTQLLAQASVDPAVRALLGTPLSRAPILPVPRGTRRLLERKTKRAKTLGELVNLAVGGGLEPELVEAVLLQVRLTQAALPRLSAPKPARPAPPVTELSDRATAAELARFAEAHGLTPFLDLGLSGISALVESDDFDDDIASWSSIRSLFPANGKLASWLAEPRRAALVGLRALARVSVAGAERLRKREPVWAERPADERLHPSWKDVRALWPRTTGPFLDLPLHARLYEPDEDPPYVEVFTPWAPEITANVPLRGKDLRLQGHPARAALQRAGVALVLDGLTDPQHALHPHLVAVLGTPAWERALRAVDRAITRPPLPPDEDKRELGWRVSSDPEGRFELTPVQFRSKKTGAGYVTRMLGADDIPAALLEDPVDAHVAGLLARWSQPPSELVHRALGLLVGHPRVMDEKGNPLTVRRARLALRVELDADERPVCTATVDGAPRDAAALSKALRRGWSDDVLVEREPGVIRLVTVHGSAVAFVRHGLPALTDLPAEAVPALLAKLQLLEAALPIDLPPALSGEEVPGDRRPLLRLRWDGAALALDVRVRPLPDAPAQVPGEGPGELRVVRGDRRVRAVRALGAESALVHGAIAELPLQGAVEQGAFSWALPSLEQALGLVEAIEARTERFQVEWSGDLLKLAPSIEAKHLKLEVGSGRDWFGLSGRAGDVALDALADVLADGGSWVKVKGGAWARIADTLKEPLGALAAVARAKDGLRVAALHAAVLDALEGAGAQLKAPSEWRSLAARMAEAKTLDPDLPAGLNAELRPYQREGWRWLARLAHWAQGAVLADDMGLGKTLQAIALLLHRAGDGPALVVAPTSVVFNWERELARFAPSLRVATYHGGGRAEVLADAAPGTVLLTTWGLLHRDADALSSVRFATAVLDEAQAMKNPTAQRSIAAYGLDAGFRLALTGTPVENRATDLWSLMRATAPGLLGGLEHFRERFAAPIASGRPAARQALAALVRPFVLRRTKKEVAPELPERTEIAVDVELSHDEWALYLVARQKALEEIASSNPGPQARFKLLAGLTRLRQLACHPRLHDPGSPVASSKLAQLRRMLADVRAGGHQALVFSQFVEHLKLVREALTEDGLRLRQLDGSTPAEQRRAEVDAFQAGDGDVFLISLKAGGTGLNLTAATYVFHLDPWWNPAVEDQATDRAHRIGQTQPVTVYRLVAKGTIEEAILSLHDEKRTLASDLLSGTATPATLDVEELVALLGSGPSEAAALPAAPTRPPAPARPQEDAPSNVLAFRPKGEAPSASAAEGAPAEGIDTADLLRRFEERIASETLTRPTARNYVRAVERLLAFAGPVRDRAALEAAITRYANTAATGTDQVFGRPAYRRLLEMV